MSLHGSRKTALVAIALLAVAGCGGAKGEPSQSDLRLMEKQVGVALQKQLRTAEPSADVRRIDCVETAKKKARCIAAVREQGVVNRYGIDVNVANDGGFLWEVSP